MQSAQPKWKLPLAVIAGCLCWSSHISGLKFVPIYEPLTIKAQKNSPPHVAFEVLIDSEMKAGSEWAVLEKMKPTQLGIPEKVSEPLNSNKFEISEMVLKKDREIIQAPEDQSWVNELPRKQALRLQEAQQRGDVLSEDWSGPSWSEAAKEVLEKSGALVAGTANSKVYVAATDASGHSASELPRPSVKYSAGNGNTETAGGLGFVDEKSNASKSEMHSIVGPIEITGGLAVTNEHHIEIRRSDEGILKELGRVDLQQGFYKIEVEEKTGSVIARLVDKDGKTLGEGSFRLNRVSAASPKKDLLGPKLKIVPQPSYSGIVSSAYNSRPTDSAPAQTVATFIKGASEATAKKDGLIAMENVTKGSTTVLRVAAPKHLQTASIVVSGQEFKTLLYPESMIQALQDIVGQQRSMSFEGSPTVIWGRVTLDGKAMAGVEVIVESAPELQAVYFNQFMLPDSSLKATSENGLYAFVDVTSGFHSLLALRENSILGYQNVIVEEGSVAQGDVAGTIKTETVPLRIYDAFLGEEKSASVTLQSLSSDLEVPLGLLTVNLPSINRVGMMRVQPEGTDYVTARYLYNDKDEYIHAPLVKWSWLGSIKSYLRIDDHPNTGFVVGFVPDEDFEVYLAAHDNFDPRLIVYFDMQGRILQNRKGMAGGGFIIYNVPADTQEVVVVGNRSQKIYSQVVPVDPESLSVLSFREQN